MKYKLDNGKEISLTDKQYVAEGGEGKIYSNAGKAYKICFDGKMTDVKKLNELKVLNEPYIIAPENIIFETNGNPIGYSMKFIDSSKAFSFAQALSKSYRDRENITNNNVIELCKKLKSGFEFVHSKKCLIVDANENNFLVSKDLKDIYFIDVNSYQTPHFPATAIMSSIRDWKSNTFNELTDWFSYAVLTFQLFIGIHPFRGGNHPKITAKEPELKTRQRVEQSISVLNKDTKYPINATYPIGTIPKAYLDWYISLFEKGQRSVPPDNFQAAIFVKQLKTIISKIKFTKVSELPGKPSYFFDSVIATDTNNFDFKNSKMSINQKPEQHEQVLANHYKDGESVYKTFLLGNKMVSKKIGSCSLYSTTLFNGCFVQNWFANNLFTLYNENGYPQINVKELKGHKVLDALYQNNVLLVSSYDGKAYYNHMVFVDSGNYTISTIKTNAYNPIVGCVSRSGMVILKNENSELYLTNKDGKTTIIEDDEIDNIINIYWYGTNAYFLKNDGILYRGEL